MDGCMDGWIDAGVQPLRLVSIHHTWGEGGENEGRKLKEGENGDEEGEKKSELLKRDEIQTAVWKEKAISAWES